MEQFLDLDGDGDLDVVEVDNDPGPTIDAKPLLHPDTGEEVLVGYRIADRLTLSCGEKPPPG